MRAEQMVEQYPVVRGDTDALTAARTLAQQRLPGIVVTDETGRPKTILPASQVVRFLVPGYVQEDPALAGVLSESMADRAAEKLAGKPVTDVLPNDPVELPVVNGDDTIVEVAAVMARLHCPLAAVVDEQENLLGVITASRLLELALH